MQYATKSVWWFWLLHVASRLLMALDISLLPTIADDGIICHKYNCTMDGECETGVIHCQDFVPEPLKNLHDQHFCIAIYNYNVTDFQLSHRSCVAGESPAWCTANMLLPPSFLLLLLSLPSIFLSLSLSLCFTLPFCLSLFVFVLFRPYLSPSFSLREFSWLRWACL